MAIDISALQIGREVDDLLTRYIAAHDACFSFSLRRVIPIPGIFKAVDFRRLRLDLYDTYAQLQEAKQRIEAALTEAHLTPEWTRFLKGLSEYTGALTTTVGWLASICSQLSDKSDGAAYKTTKYKEDLAGYQASIERHLAKGAELNRLLEEAMGGQ